MNINEIVYQLTGHGKESALEAQLREMRRELRRVSHTVSRRASHTADDWGDQFSDFSREAVKHGSHLAEEASKRGAEFAELAAYQAGRGARALRKDPVPAIAIVGTALLVASLFARR